MKEPENSDGIASAAVGLEEEVGMPVPALNSVGGSGSGSGGKQRSDESENLVAAAQVRGGMDHVPSTPASENACNIPITLMSGNEKSVEHADNLGSQERRGSGADKDLEKGSTEEGDGESEKATQEGLATHHSNGLMDQTNYLPIRQIIIVFLAMQLAVLLSFLDQTIVSSALPNISAYFNQGRSSSWVASAYLLTSTAFQPVWGRLSDVFGRKRTLLACVFVFLIGSLACALANSMVQLIIFRGLQGVGGGGLLTLVLIIVSDIVSLKERGKYQGITEITITIANGSGPILGGVLSQKVVWRWCFWINLPLAAITLVVITFCLPLKHVHGEFKQKLAQIDYGGAALTIIAATLFLLPLNWGGTSFPWISGPVLGCILAGVIGFGILFLWEAKFAKIPIVPPAIFKDRTVNTVFGCTLVAGATIIAQLFYLPQFFQIVRGDSAIRSGVLILPLLVITTLLVAFSGQLVARTGDYKPSICIGYVVWTIGLGLLSTINETTSTAKLIGYMVLVGTGQGQTLQTSMVAAQASVSRAEMSTVTSTRNFLRSLGGAISLALAAAIINNTLRAKLNGVGGFDESLIIALIDDPTGIWRPSGASGRGNTAEGLKLFGLAPEQKIQVIKAYVKGFNTLFHVLVALVGCNAVVSLIFIERHDLSRGDEAAQKAKGKAWLDQRGAKKKNAKLGGKGGEAGSQSATGTTTPAVTSEEVREDSEEADGEGKNESVKNADLKPVKNSPVDNEKLGPIKSRPEGYESSLRASSKTSSSSTQTSDEDGKTMVEEMDRS